MTNIKNIGILGGGQLGRMLAMAAHEMDMGFKCIVWEPDKNGCAFKLDYVEKFIKPYDDKEALKEFIGKVDVVVLEFENIPVEIVQEIEASGKLVAPSSKVLSIVQDREQEKKFFNKNEIPCVYWHSVNSEEDAKYAGEKLGYPLILKTNRFGYDGKGQVKVNNDEEIIKAWSETLGKVHCIAEEYIPFKGEFSIIGARNPQDKTVVYDVAKNTHKDGILKFSWMPAKLSENAREKANEYLHTAMKALDIVGLLALEMFLDEEGNILANEMAARPHNSGHWTMDGAKTSQFEQCIRAATGLPFGLCERTHNVKMINLLGDDIKNRKPQGVNEILHDYKKSEPREGRKMGHINHLSEKTE